MLIPSRPAPWIAAALFLLAAGSAWTHRIHLAEPESPRTRSDMELYYHPAYVYMDAELARGRFPAWNPHQMAGGPFLALHTPGLLYPPNLALLAALPTERALEAHAVLHLFAAGFFTWLFLRRWALPGVAAAAGAAAFMFSESVERTVYQVAWLSTIVWLPAILWALHGLLEEAQPRWSLRLALVLTLAFLGGWAQGFVYEVQLAAAYAVVCFGRLTRGHRVRATGLAALAALATLGLIAAQLLPTLELVSHGGRSLAGLTLAQATAVHPVTPRELLRGLCGAWQWGGDPFRSGAFATVALPTVLLAATGAADRARRALWLFFLASAVLTGAFMLGSHTPIFRLYHLLPFGAVFRIPRRIDFVYLFALAVVSAVGVAGAMRLAARVGLPARAAYVTAAVLAALLAMDSYAKNGLRRPHPVRYETRQTAAPDFVAPLAARAGLDRVFVRNSPDAPRLHAKLGMMYGLYVVPDYEPLLPAAYNRYFGMSAVWHGRFRARDLTRVRQQEPPGHLTLERLVARLDLMSVRYYVFDPALRDPPLLAYLRSGGATVERVGDVLVAERAQALPRAYAVFATRRQRSDAVSRLVADPSIDWRETAIVSPDGPELPRAPNQPEADVRIRTYAPHRVVIDATCSHACLVVLTDLHFPGWRATVDDTRADVHRANFLFRGVALDPGAHRVVFSYVPLSLAIGGGATVVALTLITLVAWRRRARGSALLHATRRSRPRRPPTVVVSS